MAEAGGAHLDPAGGLPCCVFSLSASFILVTCPETEKACECIVSNSYTDIL